jgi:transcriptional regulator with XRE-family HTH domain
MPEPATESQSPSNGEKVRRLREAAGLTQTQLAARLGVTQGRIGHLEQGRRPLNLETLHALALALGHDPHDLDPRLDRAGDAP